MHVVSGFSSLDHRPGPKKYTKCFLPSDGYFRLRREAGGVTSSMHLNVKVVRFVYTLFVEAGSANETRLHMFSGDEIIVDGRVCHDGYDSL